MPTQQSSSRQLATARPGGPELSVEGAMAMLQISRSCIHRLVSQGRLEGYISDPKTGRWIPLAALPGRKNKSKREIKFYKEDLEQFRLRHHLQRRRYQLEPSSVPISPDEYQLMLELAQQQLQEQGYVTRKVLVQALQDQLGIAMRPAWQKVNRMAYEHQWPLNLSRIPQRIRHHLFAKKSSS